MLEYLLNKRKINLESLKKYGIGAIRTSFAPNTSPELSIVFPYIENGKSLINIEMNNKIARRIKIRSIVEKSHQKIFPTGAKSIFFGDHLCNTR